MFARVLPSASVCGIVVSLLTLVGLLIAGCAGLREKSALPSRATL
jgi:hypothetical protein